MADHSTIFGPAINKPGFDELLKQAKGVTTLEQFKEQQVSFAYGNAPQRETLITKESVREAACKKLLSAP